MSRGRKPLPTAVKIAKGNPGKRPLGKPFELPPAKCPEVLSPEAKAEWNRVAPHLERLKLLTVVDTVALAAYCQAVAEWDKASSQLASEPYIRENGRLNPLCDYIETLTKRIRAFACEFGFTPSSRCRLEIPNVGGDVDELQDFLDS